MKNKVSRVCMGVGCALVGVGVSAPLSLGDDCPGWDPDPGETCVCLSDFGMANVTVCLSRDGPAPVSEVHFFVDFLCPGCLDAPDIELIAGNLEWQLWVVRNGPEIPPPPGDIGELRSPHPTLFEVTLERPNGIDPGAANVRRIDLRPSVTWAYSELSGGAIEGNLTELLRLQESDTGLGGGRCTLEIQGDLEGQVIVPFVVDLSIHGLGPTASIDVEEITEAGLLEIGPDLEECATGTPAQSGDIQVDVIRRAGLLKFDGNLGANVTVGRIEGAQMLVEGGVEDVQITIGQLVPQVDPSLVAFGVSPVQACPFYGDLTVQSTLVTDTSIELNGVFEAGASIDLTATGVSGEIDLKAGGAGTIITGAIVLGGAVTLAEGASNGFSGNATIFSVLGQGVVRTLGGADLSGTLTVTGAVASLVDITGDVEKTGRILVNGDCLGNVDVGVVLKGDISIGGNLRGSIDVGEDVTGDIEVTGDVSSSGSINVGGKLGTVACALSAEF